MTDSHADREDRRAVNAEGTDPDFVTDPEREQSDDPQRDPEERDDTSMER